MSVRHMCKIISVTKKKKVHTEALIIWYKYLLNNIVQRYN